MDVSGPGIESKSHLYLAAATARLLLIMHNAGLGMTCASAATRAPAVGFLTHCSTVGTPCVHAFEGLGPEKNLGLGGRWC